MNITLIRKSGREQTYRNNITGDIFRLCPVGCCNASKWSVVILNNDLEYLEHFGDYKTKKQSLNAINYTGGK